ncbi:outer membrane protein assembly factor BamA [Spiribacter sp. C176]|uniref:Outer membrane protein assembly factor BamA n=1 Tax=Spiribacter salilacus TaxID=2664894 RepID=A0A6N7QLB3_9GAMM|nr:outer membrane protein assembly factor BamA [Spiribacter salilacus]MRH77211.1 outer membrane protein assembly factor BamA [Spiribacter salilacus]
MRKILLGLILIFAAGSASGFTVEEIRIEGLSRISEGTVLNYLPVSSGDELDRAASADALEALFSTGFFEDVELRQDGSTLVVAVRERPAIAEIEFIGNKALDTDQLTSGLASAGLSQGQSFDRSLLATIERELEQQYFSLGYYDIAVSSTVSPLPRNRVELRIEITEGSPASVQEIHIVGNQAFDADTLRGQFSMGPKAWWAFLSNRDKYSRERLAADLESLRAYYRDRGYADFQIESTQVSISPDRQRIHVTVNVNEGLLYQIGELDLAGDLIFEADELRELFTIQPGDTFNQRGITATIEALRDKLGTEGYAFARINPVPELREDEQAVDITFFVDPADRVYVRRLQIVGNETTRDDVIRSEMRQLEGTWLSTKALRDSRDRLLRLGFFGDVRIDTPRVPGTTEQVDVEVETTERLSGSFRAGVGFGSEQGVILNLGLQQDNVLGTGDRLEFVANSNDSDTIYRVSYLERNHTTSGIDRRWAVSFRDTDADEAELADYGLESLLLSYGYRIPVSDNDRVGADLEFDATDLSLRNDATEIQRDFVERNGNDNQVVRANLSWTRDTRNRAIFATRGAQQRMSLQASVPGTDLEYYRLNYRQSRFFGFTERTALMLSGTVSYGDGYSSEDKLPFYENFYAGGISTVRGFERNSLGPRDENNDPTGGNLRALIRSELRLPITAEDAESDNLRLKLFVDGGQVWTREGDDNTLEDVSVSDLRFGAGVGLIYYSPVGPLTMSVATPLNEEDGDETEFFQFSIGAFF